MAVGLEKKKIQNTVECFTLYSPLVLSLTYLPEEVSSSWFSLSTTNLLTLAGQACLGPCWMAQRLSSAGASWLKLSLRLPALLARLGASSVATASLLSPLFQMSFPFEFSFGDVSI